MVYFVFYLNWTRYIQLVIIRPNLKKLLDDLVQKYFLINWSDLDRFKGDGPD